MSYRNVFSMLVHILNNKSDRLYQRFTFAVHALAYSAIFTGPTDCGKSVFSNLFSKLIKREYKKHFDHIIIICPTLRWDKIYHTKSWIRLDGNVCLLEPKDSLSQWI